MLDSVLFQRMATEMGLLPAQLQKIIRTAPLRYKVFYVPKKTGGMRELAQPAREVKALQYWVQDQLSSRLPIHEAASAYVAGASIKKNAMRHAGSKFILKMDFVNFFPSIVSQDFVKHLERHCPGSYSEREADMMSRVLFWAPRRATPLRLCIGAPTSPFISNALLNEFDEIVDSKCHSLGVNYSRYADDLTFSAIEPNVLGFIPEYISDVLAMLDYPVLGVNHKKTVHASKGVRREVTGIVITPEGVLSVGRERKRKIRAMFHRWRKGELTADQQEELKGHLAFIDSIEPGFSRKLNKY